MPPSSMNDLFAFLSQLMTEHAGLFETMGRNMFRGFAVILIAWYGIKGALASASGGAGHGMSTHQIRMGSADDRMPGCSETPSCTNMFRSLSARCTVQGA